MNTRFFLDVVVVIVCAITGLFLYQNYWDDFLATLFDEDPTHTIYIGSAAIAVTVADSDEERIQGLSGTKKLDEREGKLFIFDTDARHGIWMKDMLIPIDIIWIDKNMQVVSFKENIGPDTFPEVFRSDADARFVLEMNAHFVSSLRVKVGDRLTLPAHLLPKDITQTLQQ
jgi:uncharacterized protein